MKAIAERRPVSVAMGPVSILSVRITEPGTEHKKHKREPCPPFVSFVGADRLVPGGRTNLRVPDLTCSAVDVAADKGERGEHDDHPDAKRREVCGRTAL